MSGLGGRNGRNTHSFLEGREFTCVPDLNQQAEAWLDTLANVRIHGTTKEKPVDRHKIELAHLVGAGIYPSFDTRPSQRRLVARDSRISFMGVRYSVDPLAVAKTVEVRPWGDLTGDSFDVYLDGQLVASHFRRPKGHPDVVLSEHEAAIRRLCRSQGGKGKRPGKKVRFRQAAPEEAATLRLPLPVVEQRSLGEYEHLLLGGVR
ncbi:MAG: Mu transposase domain-containing protein [Candidatus Humimicrobiaceae bacterium]